MSLFLELVDRKITRILTTLVNNPKKHYHIQKLSSESKVPLSSTFRIINKLVKLNLVEITTIGKFKIYMLKKEREKELLTELGGKR